MVGGTTAGRIDVAAGARATEAQLLAILRELASESRADPALLARPVRVVVPSRSLRLHVAERIAHELGAVTGLEVQTLFGAAVAILDRAAGPLAHQGGGDALVDVLVRRRAAEERALKAAIGDFADGYRVVCGTVRDLFDAGFEEDLAEPLAELLAEAELGRAAKERAQAVVRTATRVARDLAERGLGGRSDLLRRAAAVYRQDPERWPARALVVHGFADATGRATDLIEAFVRSGGARVLLDRPPDPEDLTRPDLGWGYADRLRERLEGHAPIADVALAADPVQPELVRAPGALAEVQAVAARIQRALDDGVVPERIGVVARDLSPYRVALRARFDALGIPATALRTHAPIDGVGRRLAALGELLEERGRTPTDRWLDTVARLERPDRASDGDGVARFAPSHELRLGLRVLGAARLADVAGLDVDAHLEKDERNPDGVIKLPVRSGIRVFDADEDDARELRRSSRYVAPRLKLAAGELRAAQQAAKATLGRLERWAAGGPLPLARHRAQLVALVKKNGGWSAKERALARLQGALEPLAEIDGEELAFDELVRLVRPLVACAAEPPFAGQGGGVQVLDAMEARARTFERLFVLGLNRDVFPRVGREDALVADDTRRALAGLLPDVPLSARARLEDRYLFAQLVSSADAVTLSWQSAQDDGKPAVVSPLVERLFGERPEAECALDAPPFWSEAAFGDVPRPARESAIVVALSAHDPEPSLRSALAETGRADARELADVRARVLDAFERGPRAPERLAPWLGFLGAQRDGLARVDPRQEPIYVTHLEGLVRCGWQAVLQKILRIEESPDPLDALPRFEPRIVGNVVHAALQELVERATGDDPRKEEVSLDVAVGREPRPVDWSVADAEALLARAALKGEREPAPGLVRSYVACALPLFERLVGWLAAEQEQWRSGALGAEVRGVAPVPGSDVRVAFRADLVEARSGEDGERVVVLSDYKTGASKKEKDYREKGIRTGAQLQPLAYALGAADLGFAARGRYLFGAAEEPEEVPVGLGRDWREHVDDWAHAVGVVVDAWLAGELVPRVREPDKDKEPKACNWCAYAPACLRGDSGAKRALVALATGPDARPVVDALWHLPVAPERPRKEAAR